MLDEVKSGAPSHVTDDLEQSPELSDAEIRERMSGNLCRCAAYPNIVAAIRESRPHQAAR
jgi:xanthine dehydrogenase YagT iron-sulfur-binding subunit